MTESKMKTKILKRKVNAVVGATLSCLYANRGFLFLLSSASTGGVLVADGPSTGAADDEV